MTMHYADAVSPGSWPSYAEFYRTEYGQFITLLKPAGRFRASLLEAEQPAGDWSDAATPDLIIAQSLSAPAQIEFDVGAGQFKGVGTTNQFLVTPPGAASRIWIDARHRIRMLAIPWQAMRSWADSEFLRLPEDGDFGALHRSLQSDPRVTRTLDELWRHVASGLPSDTMFADASLLQLVATLADRARPAERPRISGLSALDLERVEACMRARFSEDIGLADLATVTGLSVAHFCRAFKRSTGRSPYQALVSIRVRHAQRLLASRALSVAEVALECGYTQPAHFTKLFRRETGLPPSEWRRQQGLNL